MDEKKDPVDILDEIMSRSEKPLPSPAAHPPKFDPPEDSLPPPPPAEKKPSAAQRLLPWLCVLLGGAVVALILLGIQLLSVNHQLDEIQAMVGEIHTMDELREENETLKAENQTEKNARQEAEAQAEQAKRDVDYLGRQVECAGMDREKGQMLAWLERFIREGDWLMASVGVKSFNQWYDWNWITPPTTGQPPLPGQQTRFQELRQEVLDHSDYLKAEPNPRATDDNPLLWVTLDEDKFGTGEQEAATRLWSTLWYDSDQLGSTANNVANFYGDEELMAALKGGAFRPSTLELLGQLKDDLIRRGYLTEEDGTLTPVIHYGEEIRTDLTLTPDPDPTKVQLPK